ncbi:hypothetical protein FRC01_005667 [Tulasnella sp. 417]|nr:hypothetical protein FRC01_005667 [Tulasnella sp. 417]
MSQTNPRKPALRTPNGTDTSPAAASSDAPAQPVPQPIHHPLPKHPHTYIPAHLKSNGPRTQHPRGRSSKSNTSVDESPEIKALRAKYGDKLSNLKETFGTWSDEDLLGLLSESNGNVDSVATMILEGRVEHWDSVSHKKKDKATPTGVTGGPHTAARDRVEAGGSASPGRGGFRGGRGGTPGRGGARGGRGGGAGGRGGFANGSGRVAGADGTTAGPAAENPTTTADAWGSADASASWGTDGAWGESASGASKEKEAPVPTKTPPVKGQQQSSKAPAKPQAPAGPPKMSWAQIAKKGKPAEPPVPPPVKAPASIPPPSLPATSSAQPVSEPTPSEPPAAPEPEPAPVDSTTDPVEDSAALEPQSTDEDGPEEATTAPSDDWIAVTPPNQQIPVELPTTTVPAVEEPKSVEAEVKSITTEAPKAPEPTPTAQQSSSVSTLQPTGAPPGLSPVPQPASTPSTATVTSPAATVASTAAPSVPAKSSTPRLGSSRPASRFRTTDAPVVMPGGGLPTTVFGSLSFGNAITPDQLQQQDHSSPYGAFSPLGQPQQTQGGQFGGFNNSPAGADYGYDAQRGFYDSYAQGSGFQNRPQLAHDEPAKGGLQPSTPTNVLPGQQNLNLGQGQPGGAQSGVANPGPGFGMVPYPYYQQPAYFPPPVPAQYNPYSQYKYNPYSQPPPGPSGPGPQGLQGNKPPTTGTASPYGSQHYPSQSTPYDDPASVGYQQGTTSATDYQKQQPLYGGQGLQNFFGNQSTGQNGPQLGGAQGGRASATSSSPENPYKAYGSGPGVGADKSAAGQQGGAGRAAGGPGPQSQQGGYYPNSQYSTQRQPPAQGYPQGDGQQYYSGYQPRNQYGGAW